MRISVAVCSRDPYPVAVRCRLQSLFRHWFVLQVGCSIADCTLSDLFIGWGGIVYQCCWWWRRDGSATAAAGPGSRRTATGLRRVALSLM